MKLGLVCISLNLREERPDLAFQTMTRKTFLSMPRHEAITLLSKKILHNIIVTKFLKKS